MRGERKKEREFERIREKELYADSGRERDRWIGRGRDIYRKEETKME